MVIQLIFIHLDAHTSTRTYASMCTTSRYSQVHLCAYEYTHWCMKALRAHLFTWRNHRCDDHNTVEVQLEPVACVVLEPFSQHIPRCKHCKDQQNACRGSNAYAHQVSNEMERPHCTATCEAKLHSNTPLHTTPRASSHHTTHHTTSNYSAPSLTLHYTQRTTYQ